MSFQAMLYAQRDIPNLQKQGSTARLVVEGKPFLKSGGLVIQTAPDEFIVAGTGMVITFLSDVKTAPRAVLQGLMRDITKAGKWKPGRRMNGDQSHQGRHLRIPMGRYGIQKVKLYRHK